MAGTSNTMGVANATRRGRGRTAVTGEHGHAPVPPLTETVTPSVIPSQGNDVPLSGRSGPRVVAGIPSGNRTHRSEDTSAGNRFADYEQIRRDNEELRRMNGELRRSNEETMRTVQQLTGFIQNMMTGSPSGGRVPHSLGGARQSNPQGEPPVGGAKDEETAESTPVQQVGRDTKKSLEAADIKKIVEEVMEQKIAGAHPGSSSKGYPLSAEIMGHPTRPNFKLPQLPEYYGKGDPESHIQRFVSIAGLHGTWYT